MTQNIDKPNAPTPNYPGNINPFMPGILPDASIDVKAFNNLIKNRGIRFFHSKAFPCSNINSLDDNTHNVLCPHCDGSGILYYDRREIIGAFLSNSIDKQFERNGVWEIGTATATFPTVYPDGTEADFGTYDRLEISDFSVRLWELKEYEPRVNNKQQLRYPILKTSRVETITQTERKEFLEGIDFIIEDGMIKWVDGRTPNYDSVNQRGQVYSINYYCKPIYVVLNPLRELRVTQEYINGQKTATRLPQQVVLRRDFYVNAPEKVK